jgi:hypothetical protein
MGFLRKRLGRASAWGRFGDEIWREVPFARPGAPGAAIALHFIADDDKHSVDHERISHRITFVASA